MLDEPVAVADYHRNYATQLLNRGTPLRKHGKQKRQRKHTGEVTAAPVKIWDVLDRPYGTRLQPNLREMVAILKRRRELVLDSQTEGLLLRMSRSTIDRRLRPARARRRPHHRCGREINGMLLDVPRVGPCQPELDAPFGGDRRLLPILLDVDHVRPQR